MTYDQSRDLDKILTHMENNKGQVYDLRRVKKDILPDRSIDEVRLLYYELEAYIPSLLDPVNGSTEKTFWSNDYATSFLYNGGFSKWFDEQSEAQAEQEQWSDLEKKKLLYDVKNAKRIFRTYWYTFIAAIVALAISIINLLYSIF